MASIHVTTMRELAELHVPDNEVSIFQRLIQALDENYPKDWRSWKIVNVPFEELFGTEISSKVEARLRFALPTDDIKKIFCGTDGSLSERTYKYARRRLTDWPLGRAIIYSPHAIMSKIHASPPAYETFMQTVRALKPKIYSVRGSSADRQIQSPEDPTTSQAQKRPAPPSCNLSQSTPKSKRGSNSAESEALSGIVELLSKQAEALEKLTQKVHNLEQAQQPAQDLNQSFESEPDSTGGADSSGEPENSWEAPALLSPNVYEDNEVNEKREAHLRKVIADAQRELAQRSSETEVTAEPWDFNPSTNEAEAKVAKANPILVGQAVSCQRFGEEGWKNIRYADVQKTFQATPAFCALKVNSHLATNTPNWQSLAHLEKFDLTLGAITHGLLQQREALKEVFKDLSDTSRKELSQKIFGDSKFKKISDQLLQYTCGRRAEVIQTRRETYKSSNKVLNEILHDIPPSQTHLFSEEKLSEIMKDQGGAYKFFPRKPTTTSKKTPKPANKNIRGQWKTKKPSRQQPVQSRAKYRPQEYGHQRKPTTSKQ